MGRTRVVRGHDGTYKGCPCSRISLVHMTKVRLDHGQLLSVPLVVRFVRGQALSVTLDVRLDRGQALSVPLVVRVVRPL
jgi:hypothetical protein